ncbi:uncharacterized protein LOC134835732 [Culicoides brevitarsis]|uniref:uncharacterized protein LOC134835732 n=1 Tax=Culicoides brevitarsis TaxID=469753 RepID=UPI00307B8455
MYLIFFIGLWCGVWQNGDVLAEFPGMRKPPTSVEYPGYRKVPLTWSQSDIEKDANLELFNRIRQLNARIRVLEQLRQFERNEQIEEDPNVSYGTIPEEPKPEEIEEIADVSDYMTNLDVPVSKENPIKLMGTEFAYTPQDPRYYYSGEKFRLRQNMIPAQQFDNAEYDAATNEEEEIPSTKILKQPETKQPEVVPTFNVKGPIIPNPKLQKTAKQGTNKDNNNNETDKVAAAAAAGTDQKSNVVQKQPINLDDGIGIYVVAMIAGVSAALTVAVIAVGLGWYTLRQKIKAAADLDYPAYGVTGPNKDLLYPSGDKKFAQSVDMYHYQQQKQKKNSLENKSNGETNDGFSDLDGEFDMDDGDYTVYECPGFAPTGEMEVKNPLFADEPITVATKHQPETITTEDFVVTDEKQHSPNNNKQNEKRRSPKNISPNKDKATSKKK